MNPRLRTALNVCSELVGLGLVAFVLWLAWWPLPLLLLGVLLVYIPNRK